eukprot:3644351-Amphidinium_carterae.1
MSTPLGLWSESELNDSSCLPKPAHPTDVPLEWHLVTCSFSGFSISTIVVQLLPESGLQNATLIRCCKNHTLNNKGTSAAVRSMVCRNLRRLGEARLLLFGHFSYLGRLRRIHLMTRLAPTSDHE